MKEYVKESYLINNYDYMTEEEFCYKMEIEYEIYTESENNLLPDINKIRNYLEKKNIRGGKDMLNNLRNIIDSDNEKEIVQELMLEAIDSSLADFFIDEDGEAEISESELNKILKAIPEYNEESELNKKLNRLTESYIPEYEYLEEKKSIKDKIIHGADTIVADRGKSALAGGAGAAAYMTPSAISVLKSAGDATAYLVGNAAVGHKIAAQVLVPSIAIGFGIGAAAGAVGTKAIAAAHRHNAFKYTKGEPITKSTVIKLLNACQTEKDIKKFEKWCKMLYRSFKTIHYKDYSIKKQAEPFREWIKDEIINKKLPEKKKQIMKSVKESYDIFKYHYDFMTDAEFIRELEEECRLYGHLCEDCSGDN